MRKYDMKKFERLIRENFDNRIERFANEKFDAFFEIDFITRDIEDDNHIETSIEKHDFVENELTTDDLFDVNEPDKVKSKERPFEIKKKKPFMTKIQKKVAKSIRRNFFKFEHAKKSIQIARHQQSDITLRNELKQERQNQRKQRDKERKDKKRKRKRNQRNARQKQRTIEKKKTQHQDVYTETRQRDRREKLERKLRDERQEIREEKISSAPISVSFFEITSLETSKLNENLNMSVE